MDVGVHADRVTRTGLHAHPAVDALERVDLVADRVLLDARVRMLTRLDVDALGRTGGGTKKAGRTAYRAVGLEREPMGSPVGERIGLALLWILRGGRRPPVARDAEQVQGVEHQVSREMPCGDAEATDDLGKIHPLDERETGSRGWHAPTLPSPGGWCHRRRHRSSST